MRSCPICRTAVSEGAAAFPFCSERCRLLDLGNWLDERYTVAGSQEEDQATIPEEEKH